MHEDEHVRLLKVQFGSQLAVHLVGWNSDDIAALLRTNRSRIADLRNGKLDRFSLETLVRFALRMRLDVALTLSPRSATTNQEGRVGW